MNRKRIKRVQGPGIWFSPIGNTLALAGLRSLSSYATYMEYPNHQSRSAGNRHYLYTNGAWSDACPLTGGSMANTGEITGGSQSISVAGTVESFSVIWNNAGLPVVAFSIGFNRSLTASERTALSQASFWAAILPAAIDTDDCTALYPWLPPATQNIVGIWSATSLSLNNNDPISTVTCMLGINSITQAGAASVKPTYKTNQQNSLPSMYFDGGDYLLNDALAARFSGTGKEMTCISAVNPDSRGYFLVASQASTNGFMFGLGYEEGKVGAYRRDDAGVGYGGQNADATGVTDAHINSTVLAASAVSAWINGSVKVDAVAYAGGATTLTKFTVGGWRYGESDIGHQLTGHIFETFVWDIALPTASRVAVESYLASKWGITLA